MLHAQQLHQRILDHKATKLEFRIFSAKWLALMMMQRSIFDPVPVRFPQIRLRSTVPVRSDSTVLGYQSTSRFHRIPHLL
jgi:hypothetical protein